MSHATFCRPDLDSFCRLDRLGLSVTGQLVGADHTVLACRVVEPDDWCHRCGGAGTLHDTVLRELAHVPLGWRPTILRLRVRRYRCTGCGHVWRQDTTAAGGARVKLSRQAVLWALKSVVIDRLSIARVAGMLGASWHTVNDAVLTAGRALLINDPGRFDGVRILGVDEHAWRHTRHGDRYVTVIIDLTPVRERTGAARLLDIVAGRSKEVFTSWLARQSPAFRTGIEVVAMDGFTGFKTATTEQLPDATAVMDPFHVVALAGDAVDRCRQRVQQATRGHRGRSGDPLYGIRRVLRTGSDLLTDRQRARLAAVFADDAHVEVEATWGIYQRIVAAYRQTRPGRREENAHHDHRHHQPRGACRTDRAEDPRPHPVPPSRRRSRLLRPPRHQQRTHRSDQRPTRTPTRHRPGLSQPHQLHHPRPTGHRRLPTPDTPSSAMSR